MTLLDYQVFWEINHQGSFAAAARRLHLTPSAISHAVSGMEKECGFSLFRRNKNGVVLTGAGRSLLPAVQRVLASQEALRQTLDELHGLQKGHVSIGGFNSVCTCWLPPILRRFREENPNLTVEVYQGDYDDVKSWLKDGTVELGFLSEDAAREFDFTPLSRDRLVCVAPEGFTPAREDRISVEELQDLPLILQSPGSDVDIRDFLQRNRIDFQVSCHVQDDQSSIAMAESGLGLCLVPELVLQCFSRPIRSFSLDPEEYRVIGIALPHDAVLTPAARQMLHCIRQCMDQMET